MPELTIWEVFEKMWSIVIELSIGNCSHSPICSMKITYIYNYEIFDRFFFGGGGDENHLHYENF